MRHGATVAAAMATLVAFSSPLDAQPDQAKERAMAHLKAGIAHAEAHPPRWLEACEEFKAAKEEYPASWRVMGNIGTCLMNLERDGEAIEAYDQYLSAGGKQIGANERRGVEAVLGPLRQNLVRLTITTDPPAGTLTDWRALDTGGAMPNVYQSIRGTFVLGVRAGRHTIKVEVPGYRSAIWEVELRPGATLLHDMRLEAEPAKVPPVEPKAPPEPAPIPSAAASTPPVATVAPVPPVVMERRTPVSVYVGLAATGALAAGTTVTGLVALSKRSSFNGQNDGSDPRAAKDARDSARRLYPITDILLGTTVVAAGITAYLYATRPERPAHRAQIHLAPVIGRRGAGLAISARF